jgi:hypothetical protein
MTEAIPPELFKRVVGVQFESETLYWQAAPANFPCNVNNTPSLTVELNSVASYEQNRGTETEQTIIRLSFPETLSPLHYFLLANNC